MSKISDFGVLFCVSFGGLVLSALQCTNLVTLVFLLIVSSAVMLFYYFLLSKPVNETGKFSKITYCVYSVLSSAVSAATAAALLSDTGALSNNFYIPLLILVCCVAAAFAYSNCEGACFTAGTVSLFVCVILVILLALCVGKIGDGVISSGKTNVKLLLPLCAFSVFDTVLILPYIKNRKTLFFNVLPVVYITVMTVIAMSAMGLELFYDSKLPLLHLWRSAYIPSFINRFELVALCMFLVACAVKSGIVLKRAADITGKDKIPILTVFLFGVVTLISLYSNAVYGVALLSILCGIILPVSKWIKNY